MSAHLQACQWWQLLRPNFVGLSCRGQCLQKLWYSVSPADSLALHSCSPAGQSDLQYILSYFNRVQRASKLCLHTHVKVSKFLLCHKGIQTMLGRRIHMQMQRHAQVSN